MRLGGVGAVKLRPTAVHIYAFTQKERDAVVLGLRSILEDDAGNAMASPWARTASNILDRMKTEEGHPPL